MLMVPKTKPEDDISVGNDVLAEAGLVLTTAEIARRLGITEEAARALVKETASLGRREKCVDRS
jgi:predicted transcriptional regulator